MELQTAPQLLLTAILLWVEAVGWGRGDAALPWADTPLSPAKTLCRRAALVSRGVYGDSWDKKNRFSLISFESWKAVSSVILWQNSQTGFSILLIRPRPVWPGEHISHKAGQNKTLGAVEGEWLWGLVSWEVRALLGNGQVNTLSLNKLMTKGAHILIMPELHPTECASKCKTPLFHHCLLGAFLGPNTILHNGQERALLGLWSL